MNYSVKRLVLHFRMYIIYKRSISSLLLLPCFIDLNELKM